MYILENESACEVRACGMRKCLCCKAMVCNKTFNSSITGKKFILDYNGVVNCKTKNVIYLLSCKGSGLQYVGKTSQHLHQRLSGHRQCVQGNNPLHTHLYDHFRSHKGGFENCKIQVIEMIDDNGKTLREVNNELLSREVWWIKTLCTVYPLGLNDRIQGSGSVSQNNNIVNDNVYFSQSVRRRYRSHGNRRNRRENRNLREEVDIDEVFDQLKNKFDNQEFYNCYVLLKSFPLKILRKLVVLNDSKGENACFIIDAFCSRMFNHEVKRVVESENIIIPFVSKVVDKLNISSIIKDTKIKALLPNMVKEKDFKVFHKYSKTTGSCIFNYNSFLNDLDEEKLKQCYEMNCECETSAFINRDFGHVYTGDLNVVSNDRLKELMKYGTKFREPIDVGISKVKHEIVKSVEKFIEIMSRKYRIPQAEFKVWFDKVIQILSNRLSRFNGERGERKSILVDLEVKEYLKNFHDKYIVAPADKAAGNFVIICKKLYVTIMMNELGIDANYIAVGNMTYAPYARTGEEIIDEHIKFSLDHFDITVKEKDKVIPKLFWIPKLHKTPFKSRFIAGASKCSSKELSVLVNETLKVVREYFQKYCNAIQNNSGVNMFWSIKSSNEFLDRIDNVKASCIKVFDFSTLYTSLELDLVENAIDKIIDIVYNDRYKYICTKGDKSFFSTKAYAGFHNVTASKLKLAVKFILNNTYVTFSNKIFKQVQGIPMGGNCSPLLADLFLCFCEYTFMSNLLKEKKFGLAKKLSNISRYIDDIAVVDYKWFERWLSIIYPDSLVANRSGESDTCVEYLDIKVNINEGNIVTDVFHKVDNFNFEVALYTNVNSNIPYNLGLNVFAGQVLRFGRICSNSNNFIKRIKKLLDVMLKQGYDKDKLINCMRRMFSKNINILNKFGFKSGLELSIEINKRQLDS